MSTNIALSRGGDVAQLARQLDGLDAVHGLSLKLFLMTTNSPYRPPLHEIPQLIAEAERFVASGGLECMSGAVAAALTPASREEIGKYLAKLMAAFPNANRGDLKAFGQVLAEDVAEIGPSAFALGAACKRVRQTCRFPLPSVFEVLDAIREEESRLRCAQHVLVRFGERLTTARVATERDRKFLDRKSARPSAPMMLATG